MRIIKFRAWDTHQKKMYRYVEHTTYNDGSADVTLIADAADYRFSPNAADRELLQFTEMQDSYERDIYDGDSVEIKQPFDTIRASVFWGEVSNSYQWTCGQTWLFRFPNGTQGPVLPYLCYGYKLRILGAIYENATLLSADGGGK